MATATLAPPRPLAKRQAAIYDFIFGHTLQYGYQPSLREIMVERGLRSVHGVHESVRTIERKGWIEMAVGESRSIRFLYCPDGRPFRGFEAK
jgi:SOS-response transcriptional repressor LexA